MKRYLLYSLKRYVPLYIVTFVVCISCFLATYGGTIPVQNVQYQYAGGEAYGFVDILGLDSGLIVLMIPVFVFSIILPFFANSYRYSLKAADTFYQIGKGKKSIRFVNNLLLLGAFIASFTAAFIFAVLILFARQAPNIGKEPLVEIANEDTVIITNYLFYNFAYYIPAYLLLVVIAILNYFISYFFVTRANNLINSMITLALGEIILAVGIMTPFFFLMIVSSRLGVEGGLANLVDMSFLTVSRTSVIIGPFALIYLLFDGLINGTGSALIASFNNFDGAKSGFALALTIVCLLAFIAMGVLGVLYFLKEKESSGELAGRPVPRDKFLFTVFHIGFGFIGFWIATLQSLLGTSFVSYSLGITSIVFFLSEMGFYGAAYYVLFGLLRRNFKLNKKELLTILINVGINLILGLTFCIIYMSVGVQ